MLRGLDGCCSCDCLDVVVVEVLRDRVVVIVYCW